MKINRLKAYHLMRGFKRKYECYFFKKDGSNRKMICSNDFPKPIILGKSPASNTNALMLVFDVEKNNYRAVNLKTIYKIVHNNQVYEVN